MVPGRTRQRRPGGGSFGLRLCHVAGAGEELESGLLGGLFPVLALGFVLVLGFLLDVFGRGTDEGLCLGEVFVDSGELLWGRLAKADELVGDEVEELVRG